MTTTGTTQDPSTPAPKVDRHEVAFEHLVAGRLALQVLRNQLDSEIAQVRAQLAVLESQKHHAEDMLRRAEEKLERQHPTHWVYLVEEAAPGVKRQRR